MKETRQMPNTRRNGCRRRCAMRWKNALAAGEQAMLFLNRRGYAPLTLCEACGHKFTCPQLLGLAGGAQIQEAAGLSSMRL